MPTTWFGNDYAAVVQDTQGDLVEGGQTYTAWTEETGGTQITDLVDGSSAALPGGVIPLAADGRLRFGDPTGTYYKLWIEEVGAGRPRNVVLATQSLGELLESGLGTGTVTSVAGVSPTSGNVPLTPALLGALDQTTGDARYLQPINTTPRPVPPIPLTRMVWGGTAGHPYVSVGAGGTITDDPVVKVTGRDLSIKMVTPGTGVQAAVGKYILPAMDMSDQIPVLWLRVDGMASLIDYKFYLGDNSFTNYYRWDLLENAAAYPFQTPGKFVAISLPLGTATKVGTPNNAALTSLQLVAYDNNTATPVTIWWGGFGFMQSPKAPFPNGAISISLDDGHGTALSKAAPKLSQYGYRATAYMIAGILQAPVSFPTYLTLAQTRELQDQHGWAIASHAFSTAMHSAGYDTFTGAQVLADMWAVRGYLASQGFNHADHFALPLGAYNADTLESGLHVFRSMRTLVHPGFESSPPADRMRLRAVSPMASTTLAQMKAWVDQAVAGGDWVHLTFHGIVDSSATGTDVLTSDFNDLIDYINSSGAAVRTVPEMIDSAGRAGELSASLAGYHKLTGANSNTAATSLVQQGSFTFPDDGSSAGTWPNRLEYRHVDTATATTRTGTYVNPRTHLRARQTVADSEPAFWALAHPSQGTSVPIERISLDDLTAILEVFTDRIVASQEIHVPYWVSTVTGQRLFFGNLDPNTGAYGPTPNVGDGWLDFG